MKHTSTIPIASRLLLQSLRAVGVAALAAATAAACGAGEPPPEQVGETSSALGITGLFPTGVDANGTPLATGTVDPHYTLTTVDPTLGAMPKPVAVNAQMSMGGAAAWTPNTASSKWISIRASAVSDLLIDYTYSTTFNLNGADPTTATLSGALACDDQCVLRLNGTTMKTFASPAWPQSTAFSIPAGSPFVAGQNTLSVVVTNSGGIVTGLQITNITPGCTMDSQCASTQFCNTQANACTAKLPDGTPVPMISGHTPALTGTCSAAVGTAVCVSGTCNMTTNDCGAAAPPTCTMDSQCASTQFCDTQTMTCTGKLPDGTPIPTISNHTPPLTGTCSTGVGAAICLSGMCNITTNDCGAPAPACTMDSDCASTQFCNTETMTCEAKLPNGDMIPTLTGHTPDLSGMCTTAVGTAVCASGVCDTTDSECGLANGDGPCTAASGGTVCQSGVCAANGTCAPGATCTMDSDCAATQFCNTQAGMCTAKLPNGTPIPTLTGHTPPLMAVCTPDTGAAVCISAVCDTTDDDCGYADGDGPCTQSDATTVCQSGVCNAGGTCGPGVTCTVDSDCTNPATPVCDPTLHICVPGDGGTGNADDGGSPTGDASPNGDASTARDASARSVDGGPDLSGFVEGGGCSIAEPSTSSGTRGARGAEAFFGAALALAFTRRRRATPRR